MNSKDLFEHHIDKALREDPYHFGKSVVMEAFEKTLQQVKNNDSLHSVSGSLPCGKATCKYDLNETERACDFCNDRIKTNSH